MRSFVCLCPQEVPKIGTVRCWRCDGCRQLRAWLRGLKMQLEALGHDDRVWLATLTFKEETSDDVGYPEVQKWLKRVRKSLPASTRVRYTCVCELGSRNRRLHYHLVVYTDASCTWRKLNQWSAGHAHFKLVNGREAVRYVLKYVGKGHGKVRSSVRLGAETMDRVHQTVHPVLAAFPGSVVVRVGACKVPRELQRDVKPVDIHDDEWKSWTRDNTVSISCVGMSAEEFDRLYRLQMRGKLSTVNYLDEFEDR